MENLVLVELSRAFAGSELGLVEAAQQSLTPAPKIVVVGLEPQRELLNSPDITFEVTDGYDANVQQAVAKAISEYGEGRTCTVYSFHPEISSGRSPILEPLSNQVTFTQAGKLLSPSSKPAYPDPRDAFEWPEELMSLDDALVALQSVLSSNNADQRPVLKTYIRPWLNLKDPRFNPENRHPGVDSPRLMTRLLHHAKLRGIIQVIGAEPRVSVRLLQHVERTVTPTSIRDHSSDSERLASKESRGSRSEQFQTILLQTVGLFPDVRELLLDHIETTQKAQAGKATAGQVIKQAIKLTLEASPDAFPRKNNDDLPKDKYPWRKVEGFALNILARAGLIVDADGQTLANASPWAIRSGYFSHFPPEWKTLVDAELVYELVAAQAGVSWNDGEDLAGALWCARDEDYIHRVDAAIDHLFAENRVVMAKAGQELQVNRDEGRHRA
ncbi:hypothetical protein [Mycobacterium sp. E802]|uniref:hypothetical protein n=1 Tax=Mycobacterium sp. E802 TaxID=1834152 RepID=UPI000B1056EA|nr:hypothetical protein [Mycobacterium sp. E802]